MYLEMFPSGVRLGGFTLKAKTGKPVGGRRGSITGFSAASAARLRWWCLSMYVPGCTAWGCTRTVRAAATPEQWRDISKRWRTAINDLGWAETWRVELQRRAVPHVHSVLWLPDGLDPEEAKLLWLRATGETGDEASERYSMQAKPLLSGAWAAYIAAHAGKHKGAQLGWLGKQWGVIGKARFRRLPGISVELSAKEATWFARFVRRWIRARYGFAVFARDRGFTRLMDGSALPHLAASARRMCSQAADSMVEPF